MDNTIPASDPPPTFPVTPTWLLAGKAIFTVSNPRGEHYTYRVALARDQTDGRPPAWFASLLAGPDNEEDYQYLGLVRPQTGELRLTRASRLADDSLPVKVLRWALRVVWSGRVGDLPPGYGINGAGRCGRCGRTLTHPDGVAAEGYRLGFGPECFEKIGGLAKEGR